jgi:hypothetical protein
MSQALANKEVFSPQKALKEQLEAPELDPIVLGVANDYLAGKSINEIAESYDVAPDVISSTLDKKEVKNYIDNVYLSQGFMSRFKRIDLINKIIEEKVQESLETGVLSKKDVFDYLKLLNDMEKEAKPKDKGPGVAIQVNNNYENLMQDLLKKE